MEAHEQVPTRGTNEAPRAMKIGCGSKKRERSDSKPARFARRCRLGLGRGRADSHDEAVQLVSAICKPSTTPRRSHTKLRGGSGRSLGTDEGACMPEP
eukprot:scaffold576_cov336-Pavlova_lutheri.AAC.12